MRLKIEHNKRNFILTGAAALLAVLLLNLGAPAPWTCFVTIALFYAIIMLNVTIEEKFQPFIAAALLVSSAVVTMFSVQFVILDMKNFMKTTDLKLYINVVLILAFYLIVMLITNHVALTVTISHSILLLWGFVDYFVYKFRGNEMTYADLRAASTGLSVAGGYRLQLHSHGAIVLYATMLLFVFVWKWNVKMKSRKVPMLLSGLSAVLCVIIVVFQSAGVVTETWEVKGTYRNGYFFNYVLGVRDSFIKAPEGYSVDAVAQLEEEYKNSASRVDVTPRLADESGKSAAGAIKQKPTIIAIMSESYADLSVLADFQTNKEVTPFYNSLKENTLKGYALSSVYGAKTPNSEWEFMTGNTMAFLPTGSVVYQQYIKDDATSLVSTLKKQGYTCVAMHPYYKTGWSRDKVYPSLGFDETYFIDDFPKENVVREYVSDEELFDQIIKRYEEKEDGQPLFMMNVTMQNHGGYATTYPNFTEDVYKLGRSYTDANQYLSLIHKSDQALEKLITYFQSVKEPVEIVFFGDHQPGLSEGFYKIITGKGYSNLELDETENYYKVPFFIWTNYESQEAEVELTSLNFLATYTLERAGVEMTPYERFLSDFRSVIPAINSVGYYSKNDKCYKKLEEATGEEAEWIKKYRILQYISMFDSKNKSSLFFPDKS